MESGASTVGKSKVTVTISGGRYSINKLKDEKKKNTGDLKFTIKRRFYQKEYREFTTTEKQATLKER